MPSKTATRSEARPPAPPQSKTGTRLTVAAAVVIAMVIGVLIGALFVGGTNRSFTGSYGSVQILDTYRAKVTFVNGNNAGCLLPVGSQGHGKCYVFEEVPGLKPPKLGDLVNAVIMQVETPDGNGYQLATLWPKNAPA